MRKIFSMAFLGIAAALMSGFLAVSPAQAASQNSNSAATQQGVHTSGKAYRGTYGSAHGCDNAGRAYVNGSKRIKSFACKHVKKGRWDLYIIA